MSLTIEHIAQLARLELSAEEKERYRQQLSAILDYADRLKKLDTGHTLPTSSVLPPRSVLRQDIPATELSVEDVLKNAAQTHANQFRVPPVME
jgi:aspartyl-tRNA(Asn)/glutamyl-tRNA(Gln) amidotransferase subunit C